MQLASIILALMTIIISALILMVTVKGDAMANIRAGLRGNLPWMALLLFAMALDMMISLLVPNPSYLLRMSAQTEIFPGISIWLQGGIPASFGPTLFALIYYMAFAIFMITLPLYLLAMGENAIFKRYCLSLTVTSLLLVLFKLTVLSVRPSLDPASGSVGPLFSDPFWGPISLDLSPKGNSFPSGHALTLMAASIAVWPLKCIRIMVLALLSVIVLTVLYLDIHWPIDVIVGIALGTVCALAAITFVKMWEKNGSKLFRTRSEGK
ncbi:MAG: phosphatase PAP2 family protein [Methanomassiliicoccales archaeon]|jgi:membrane-associated phospholipid phosphatase